MKAYGWVAVKIRVFLTSELAGGWAVSFTHRPLNPPPPPRTHCTECWETVGVGNLENLKFLTVTGLELRPLGCPACSPQHVCIFTYGVRTIRLAYQGVAAADKSLSMAVSLSGASCGSRNCLIYGTRKSAVLFTKVWHWSTFHPTSPRFSFILSEPRLRIPSDSPWLFLPQHCFLLCRSILRECYGPFKDLYLRAHSWQSQSGVR
jgi:hypothetical protein